MIAGCFFVWMQRGEEGLRARTAAGRPDGIQQRAARSGSPAENIKGRNAYFTNTLETRPARRTR